jgi:hypothetical protein
MAVISKVGIDGFNKFKNIQIIFQLVVFKPLHKITRGSHQQPYKKGGNRLKVALRKAANVIRNLKDTRFSYFFKKILNKADIALTISATARKLGVILWNMTLNKETYKQPTDHLLLHQQRKHKMVKTNKENYY